MENRRIFEKIDFFNFCWKCAGFCAGFPWYYDFLKIWYISHLPLTGFWRKIHQIDSNSIWVPWNFIFFAWAIHEFFVLFSPFNFCQKSKKSNIQIFKAIFKYQDQFFSQNMGYGKFEDLMIYQNMMFNWTKKLKTGAKTGAIAILGPKKFKAPKSKKI